jgi:hypothetical protein
MRPMLRKYVLADRGHVLALPQKAEQHTVQ